MTAPPQELRFEYRGWLVEVTLFEKGPLFGGRATLKSDGKHRCTMSLVNPRANELEATSALELKAKALIDEWAYQFTGSHVSTPGGGSSIDATGR